MSQEQLTRLSEEESERLSNFYAEAEREILKAINKALLKGNKTEYLQAMLTNVQAILKDLRAGSRAWCQEAIPRLYLAGVDAADSQLKEAKVKVITGFGAIHQQAVNILASNTFSRMEEVSAFIGRRADDIYRTLALENVAGSVTGYETWQQVARNFREQLAAQGVTGFRDKSNREWNLKTYANMVARTTTQEAHTQGTLLRIREHGHDLVIVSQHSGTCSKCAPWEKKVLSITGQTPGYPTVDEARAAGLLHPNCRHALSLYFDIDAEIAKLEKDLGEGSSAKPTSRTVKTVDALPNYKNVVIPEEKFTRYALDKEHRGGGRDKAIAFEKALGYNKSNYLDLIESISENIGNYKPLYKGSNQYGDKYEVVMDLKGPNGKTAKVLTAWIVEKTGITRLVSVYVTD